MAETTKTLNDKDVINTGEEATTSNNDGEWVTINFKLMDWSYMDFSRTVRVDTTIHTIKETIKTWHGGKIAKLTLCKHAFLESNELRNDKQSLKECGLNGDLSKKDAPVVEMHYNLIPSLSDKPDPILMC